MKPAYTNQIRCTVVGAENLPAEIGGPDAVCRTMLEAVSSVSGIAANELSITVQIINAHSAAASVARVDGRKLADQRVGISDRDLNRHALAMLAKAVATELNANL
jgi:hypothetical protein